eukprot:4219309-Karenia_brevis.AAC.1
MGCGIASPLLASALLLSLCSASQRVTPLGCSEAARRIGCQKLTDAMPCSCSKTLRAQTSTELAVQRPAVPTG